MTAMTDEKRVSADRLREIVAGCDGVTPGPWRTWAVQHIYHPGDDWANICSVSEPRASKEVGYTEPDLGSDEPCFNAMHIARLDPDTVKAICTELLARRSQVPDGWQLVPVEPTEAMIGAGVNEAHRQGGSYAASAIYRVMLAAAPSPKEGK